MELVHLYSPVSRTYNCLAFRKTPTIAFQLNWDLWDSTLSHAFRLNKDLQVLVGLFYEPLAGMDIRTLFP